MDAKTPTNTKPQDTPNTKPEEKPRDQHGDTKPTKPVDLLLFTEEELVGVRPRVD